MPAQPVFRDPPPQKGGEPTPLRLVAGVLGQKSADGGVKCLGLIDVKPMPRLFQSDQCAVGESLGNLGFMLRLDITGMCAAKEQR